MDILKDTEILCMGCMEDKGNVTVCPFSGYDETKPISPLTLPPRTQLLHGQYLVQVRTFFEENNTAYLVMDYCETIQKKLRIS